MRTCTLLLSNALYLNPTNGSTPISAIGYLAEQYNIYDGGAYLARRQPGKDVLAC